MIFMEPPTLRAACLKAAHNYCLENGFIWSHNVTVDIKGKCCKVTVIEGNHPKERVMCYLVNRDTLRVESHHQVEDISFVPLICSKRSQADWDYDPRELALEVNAQAVREHLDAGRVVEAIMLYKLAHGCTTAEAKAALNRFK